MSAAKRKFTALFGVIIYLAVASATMLACVFGVKAAKLDSISDAQFSSTAVNVILMIGDGMGFNHLKCAEAYSGEELYMRSADYSGEVETFSRSYPSVTDSAAAATAMATGVKVKNGRVSRDKSDLETSAEFAVKHGLAAGVISTESAFGATPAAFSSHADSRKDNDEIFKNQLSSGITFFACATSSYYDEQSNALHSAGYNTLSKLSELVPSTTKTFAAFSSLPARQKDETDSAPLLSSVSEKAIGYLDAYNDKGFFLMIEEAHIDKRSHSNDISSMIAHLLAYDRAVEAVVGLANGIGNTLVIVTADHETGGLYYSGETAAELNDDMYSTGGHTPANVPYFVFGSVGGLDGAIDNTQIHFLVLAVLSNNF